jgi:hypothetical protein
MKLFLDTEFNGFGGKLMSLALVPEYDRVPNFYCELEMTDQLDPWVRENVVPHMILVPSTMSRFHARLSAYLLQFQEITIVADWPDDIRYFCESLITGPGERINIPTLINFELDLSIEYESKVPHNALHDAIGIQEYYRKRNET